MESLKKNTGFLKPNLPFCLVGRWSSYSFYFKYLENYYFNV